MELWAIIVLSVIIATLAIIIIAPPIFLHNMFRLKHEDGAFLIDTSNPERDIYRIELGDELEKLTDKKFIVLRVKHAHRSQEKQTL